MQSTQLMAERNRTMGKEVECSMFEPGQSNIYVPPGQRRREEKLIEVSYIPAIEKLPTELQRFFDGEIPSRDGFTTFGRLYPETHGKQPEIATNASVSVVEIIKNWYRGQAYLHKVGQFYLQVFNDPQLSALAKKSPFEYSLPQVELIVQRTLGVRRTTLGMHENYLADGTISLKPERNGQPAYGPVLMSHVVTRLWALAGGVRDSVKPPFNEEYVAGAKLTTIAKAYGECTTADKPLINTRNEPFADPSIYRRNHITSGDGGMWPWPEFMKFTTTSLIHRLIENGFDCSDVILDDPVQAAEMCALVGINGPASINDRIANLLVMVNGQPMHPLELQLRLVEKCEKMAESCYISPEERYALVEWRRICTAMLEDALACQTYVEFIGKLVFGTLAIERHNAG